MSESTRRPGVFRQTIDAMKGIWDRIPTIGRGHAAAWFRAGHKELAQNILPAFPSDPRPIEEPGLVGNPTNYEVSQQRRPERLDERLASLRAQQTPTLEQEKDLERD
jgi:hypothetical protein